MENTKEIKLSILPNEQIRKKAEEIIKNIFIPYFNGEQIKNYTFMADVKEKADPEEPFLHGRFVAFGDEGGSLYCHLESMYYEDPLHCAELTFLCGGVFVSLVIYVER